VEGGVSDDVIRAADPNDYYRIERFGANGDYIALRSREGAPKYHAEQLGMTALEDAGVDLNRIAEVYTEYEPCRSCLYQLKSQLRSNVMIDWSFRFPGAEGQAMRDAAVGHLFAIRRPYIFDVFSGLPMLGP